MKYRIKAFDLVNDIWLLQQKIIFGLHKTVGVGSGKEVNEKCDELNDAARPPDAFKIANEARVQFRKEILSFLPKAQDLVDKKENPTFSCGILEHSIEFYKTFGRSSSTTPLDWLIFNRIIGPTILRNLPPFPSFLEAEKKIEETHQSWGGGQIDVDLYINLLNSWKLGWITESQLIILKEKLKLPE